MLRTKPIQNQRLKNTTKISTSVLLKGSDDSALHLKESCFSSIVKRFLKNTTFRKLDLVAAFRKIKLTPTLLGPLEGAGLNHWTTEGPNRVVATFILREDGNRSSFRNVVFL
jgi:hypothetical protein